jgi:hypothetical protein
VRCSRTFSKPNVLTPDAANVAARPTKALSASRASVQNASAATAKASWNPRATPETTALECKLRYAKNTTRTNVPFVHAIHVAFEVTNYNPAICVILNMYALCTTAKNGKKVTTTSYAHVLSGQAVSARQTRKLLCVAKNCSYANSLDFDADWRNVFRSPSVLALRS